MPGPWRPWSRSRRPGGRLAAIGEMVVCSGFPTQLALAILFRAAGLAGGRRATGSFRCRSWPWSRWPTRRCSSGSWCGSCKRAARPERSSGWARRPLLPEIVRGVLLTPLILAGVGLLLLAIQQWAPQLHNVPVNPLEALARGGPMEAATLGVVAVVAGAVREELQRAFLLDRFERHVGPVWSAWWC